MMLIASLVCFKRLPIFVIAQKSVLEPLAARDGISDRGSADHESRIHDAGQGLQFSQLRDEFVLVFI